MKIARLFLGIIILIAVSMLLLEMLLNSLSRLNRNVYKNPGLEKLNQSFQSSHVLDHNLYFVGDSFTFGLGTSKSEYSYPNQLCKLLESQGIKVSCHNLGYPGTTSRDHLEVIEKLPENSTIFLRTGLNDSWNTADLFKIKIFQYAYEVRILKFLILLFVKLTQTGVAVLDDKKLTSALDRLVKERSLTIFFYEYPFHQNLLVNIPDRFVKIPCWEVLRVSGLAEGKNLKNIYLSADNHHLNDLGYAIDARVLFNFLAEMGYFGLDPSKKLPHIEGNKNLDSLRVAFDSLSHSIMQTRDHEKLYKLILEILHLGSLLSRIAPADLKYSKFYDAALRILIFGFRDTEPLSYEMRTLRGAWDAGPGSELEQEKAKMIQYHLAVMKSSTQPEQLEAVKQLAYFEQIFFDYRSKVEKIQTGFLKDMPRFYPLEFCPKFLVDSQISAQQISIKKDWELVVGREMDLAHYKLNIPECCIQK